MLLSFVIILQSCYKRSQRIQKTNTSQHATIFCNHLAKLLQKIIASRKPTHHSLLLSFVIILQSCYKRFKYKRQQHPEKPTHHMMLLSFVIILQSCYKRSQHPEKPTHHITSQHALSFVIILQSCYKRSQHPENQHITACCDYLL